MTPLDFMKKALQEDAPQGDSTCRGLIENLKIPVHKTLGHFIAKQDLVLSGIEFLKTLPQLNLDIDLELFFKDGDYIKKGQKIAQVYGPWTHLLYIERSTLNFMGHFSGIATLTNQYVQQVSHTSCKILDTRKTLPLYRLYEKKAVVHGGGQNHRMNLSDEIMLKENHITRLKTNLHDAVSKLKIQNPKIKITVECQTLDEVRDIVQASVDQILLDNMDNASLSEAVKSIPKPIKSEASGNMSLERVKSVAETGVDFISVGAITHSAPVADISFLIDK